MHGNQHQVTTIQQKAYTVSHLQPCNPRRPPDTMHPNTTQITANPASSSMRSHTLKPSNTPQPTTPRWYHAKLVTHTLPFEHCPHNRATKPFAPPVAHPTNKTHSMANTPDPPSNAPYAVHTRVGHTRANGNNPHQTLPVSPATTGSENINPHQIFCPHIYTSRPLPNLGTFTPLNVLCAV